MHRSAVNVNRNLFIETCTVFPSRYLTKFMTALTLPNLDESFFNIECRDGVFPAPPPLPDNLQLPPIINEIDQIVNDINIYNNHSDPTPNTDRTSAAETKPNNNEYIQRNKSVAAMHAANKKRKARKQQLVANCKTSPPKKKYQDKSGPRCPWPELGVTQKKKSSVLCFCS